MKSPFKNGYVRFLLTVFLFLPALCWNMYCGGGGGGDEGQPLPEEVAESTAEWGFELSPTKGAITGTIFDADGKPLEGVTLQVRGQSIIAKSQSDGRFGLPYEPKNGSEEILVDVSISGFTTAHKLIRVNANRTATIGKVYLVQLDTATTAIGSSGGIHTSANGNMVMDIPEGAVTTEQNFRTTWFPAGKTLPGDLPETSFFTYAMELEPDGAEFTKPVKTKFKNERGFAPGTPIPVGYFNKETGRWEHEGMGVVDSTGEWIEYEVNHFSPRDINYPTITAPGAINPEAVEDQTAEETGTGDGVCGASEVKLASGDLIQRHALPSYKINQNNVTNMFVYQSYTVAPQVSVAFKKSRENRNQILPQQVGFKVEFEGAIKDYRFKSKDEDLYLNALFAAQDYAGRYVTTGLYDYSAEITNFYDGSYGTANCFGCGATGNTGIKTKDLIPLKSTFGGLTPIVNNIDSAYGSGWG
ncbi:MAG: hypothetical protein ABIE74_04220, partial [Pseudomonadota bacterium]